MAAHKNTARNPSDNLLDFACGGLEVRPRHDCAGVELRVRNGKRTARLVLAPVQAVALANQLFSSAIAVAYPEKRA
jgi:hypothetical protein